jgi:hypothetical protein
MASAQELHLKDGTVIRGELVSFINGTYTFSSQGLGTIQIPAAQVTGLTNGNQTTSRSPQPNPAELQQIQNQMLNDPETMQLLESLQNDPDFLALMEDPEIMHAIQSGDFKSLENNPKLQKIMEKPQVNAIKQKYGN